MSDSNSCEIFASLFAFLAGEYMITGEADRQARRVLLYTARRAFEIGLGYDFAWMDMRCDEELVLLGLAERRTGEGEDDVYYIYGPEGNRQ